MRIRKFLLAAILPLLFVGCGSTEEEPVPSPKEVLSEAKTDANHRFILEANYELEEERGIRSGDFKITGESYNAVDKSASIEIDNSDLLDIAILSEGRVHCGKTNKSKEDCGLVKAGVYTKVSPDFKGFESVEYDDYNQPSYSTDSLSNEYQKTEILLSSPDILTETALQGVLSELIPEEIQKELPPNINWTQPREVYKALPSDTQKEVKNFIDKVLTESKVESSFFSIYHTWLVVLPMPEIENGLKNYFQTDPEVSSVLNTLADNSVLTVDVDKKTGDIIKYSYSLDVSEDDIKKTVSQKEYETAGIKGLKVNISLSYFDIGGVEREEIVKPEDYKDLTGERNYEASDLEKGVNIIWPSWGR